MSTRPTMEELRQLASDTQRIKAMETVLAAILEWYDEVDCCPFCAGADGEHYDPDCPDGAVQDYLNRYGRAPQGATEEG